MSDIHRLSDDETARVIGGIGQTFQGFEADRRQLLKYMGLFIAFAYPLLGWWLYQRFNIIMLPGHDHDAEGKTLMGLVMLAAIIPVTMISLYNNNIRGKLLPTLIAHYPGLAYSQSAYGFSTEELSTCKLFSTFDRAVSSDVVTGQYDNLPFTMFTVELSHGSGKRRQEIFHGAILTSAFPRRFKGHTLIRRDRTIVGNWLTSITSGPLHTVKLEDRNFEAKYEVYSSDQIEARYILTPSFMERMQKLEDLYRRKPTIALYDEKILIAFSRAHRFSVPLPFLPTDWAGVTRNFFNQIQVVLDIIDDLKLNLNIGL